MKHLSNWIEIPVEDMDRARAFYRVMDRAGNQYSLFPAEDRFTRGARARNRRTARSSP